MYVSVWAHVYVREMPVEGKRKGNAVTGGLSSLVGARNRTGAPLQELHVLLNTEPSLPVCGLFMFRAPVPPTGRAEFLVKEEMVLKISAFDISRYFLIKLEAVSLIGPPCLGLC